MRLTVFNGSPRHKKSNTDVFIEHFLKGFCEGNDNSFELHHIYPKVEVDELRKVFADAEAVLLAFPLYVDAMPSAVKEFIDALAPYKERNTNPAMLFFVQSGFPEAFHSRSVEKYLLKLARRLRSKTPGVIIKGGGEGIKEMPSFITKGVFRRLHKLGSQFADTGILDQKLLKKIAGVERFGWFRRVFYGLLIRSGLADAWWHGQMKANNCLEDDKAQPYQQQQ